MNPILAINGLGAQEDIVAIISVFGMPVLIVFFVMLFSFLTNRRRYQAMADIAKSGHEIPEALTNKKKKDVDPLAKLQSGLVMIAVGIGTSLFFYLDDERIEMVGLCSIVTLMGVAYIIVALIARKDKQRVESAAQECNETESSDETKA